MPAPHSPCGLTRKTRLGWIFESVRPIRDQIGRQVRALLDKPRVRA